MRKQQFLIISIIGMIFALNAVMLTTSVCSAGDVYWTDDFTDGNYYPEWNITIGSWAAGVGILRSTDSVGSPHQAIIRRESTCSYGTWTFDLLYSDTGTKVWIGFMHNVMCYNVFDPGLQGYILELNGTHITLLKSTPTTLVELDTTILAPTGGTYSVQITRTSDGNFEVRWEASLYLTALDTDYTTSTYFTLGSAPHGYGIDNIVVNGTDGLTAPPPIPGFPAAAIILGTLTAISFTLLRRRRTPA
jgi:hypothetical protein